MQGPPPGADAGPVSLASPNPENKLFVGGAPPGTDEQTLQQIFAEHGEVEEVFVMRGGSRSGQACAFVRFTTAEGAVAAIQAIHGKYIMPGCTDPLVVRYADAPGSRAKKGGGGGRTQGGFNGYGGQPNFNNGGGFNAQLGGGWAGAYGGGGWPGQAPFNGFGAAPNFLPFGLNAAAMGAAAAGGLGQFGNQPNQALAPLQQQQAAALANVYGLNALGAGANPNLLPSSPAVVSGKPVDGATDWAAYTAPDGRTYYYNAKTGISSWEKPMTAAPFGLGLP